ncbi:unnamed protein product [Adineta ricciae]|uniref:Uncharacterized protein n=1 Tax=Adineta ricciae TaxID=249248 RepID=A0A815M7T7_ADIRI|nr:unnamed protein product [Adineta ricciae]
MTPITHLVPCFIIISIIFFNGAESNIYSSNRLYRTRLNTGDRSANIIAISEIYDPSSGTWSVTGSLAQGREQHAATVLKSGKVLVTGGEGLTVHYETPSLFDTQVTELVSGCLFKTPYKDYIQPAELYLDIPYDSSSSLGDYFKTTIIFDLAKAAQVDPTRIMYLSLQAYYDEIQQKMITLVKVSLLPSATAEVSDATVRMIVDTLVNNQLDTSSVLYTGTKFLKYLRNNLTQKSNVELGLITSTSITTTTTSTSDPIDLISSSTTTPEPASNETASIPPSKCSILSTNSKSLALNLFAFFIFITFIY